MTCDLVALCWDADDPCRLARFWAGLLGWTTAEDGTTLLPDDDTGFVVRFLPTAEPRTGRNRAHPDLTSTSLEGQRRMVARALDLGARHRRSRCQRVPRREGPGATAEPRARIRPGR